MTEPELLQQIDRTCVRFRGCKLSYFSGCDYFRLSSHPQVVSALQAGLKKYGLNVGASRLTTGNHLLYAELEERLARFFGAEAAVLVSSGYISDLVIAQALAGNFSHVLIDQQAHPALGDAAHFLQCPVLRVPHRDPQGLAAALQRCGPATSLILLTDGVFSEDGSTAPLREYQQLLPKDAVMLVDDAHGAGVLGRHGRGTAEHEGADRARIIQSITLSKAFGTYGGAVLGSRRLRRKIFEHSHLFVGSTPLPLPLASAALQSIKILATDHALRTRLARNARLVKQALAPFVPETPGPILALVPQGAGAISRLKRALLGASIYPPFIKYPGGALQGYFRFAISSEHTQEQLEWLVGVLARFLGETSASLKESSTSCSSRPHAAQNPKSSPS